MEKRSSCNNSVLAKMEHHYEKLQSGRYCPMLGTLGTTDMALQYLEQPVNKLVMLVENERLRWYAWVQSTKGSLLWMIEKFQYVLTYQVEPYVEGTIETFAIVNSWLLPLLKLHQCKPKNNTPLLYFTFTYFLHCYWYLFCFVE